MELKPGNLNSILTELFPLLQADAIGIGHGVKLETSDVPELQIDEKELRQLLLNMVCNGFEAMEPGGTVTIKTYHNKDEVILSVSDTGHGVSKEVMDKLGTPFLTTKEKGTGLGLSVCYRIVQRHGAKIDVKTSAKGTTFFVKFKAG